MSNESQGIYSQKEEEKRLVHYYNAILNEETKPSIEYQKKFLLQLLNTKISQIEPKTGRRKLLHFILRISIMILSGISTVILGLKFGNPGALPINLNNIVLAITATVTLISGLSVFLDTENYWIRNKIMLNKLKELRYEYVFFLAGSDTIKTEDLRGYLDKFLASLGDEYWEKFLKDIPKNNIDTTATKK